MFLRKVLEFSTSPFKFLICFVKKHTFASIVGMCLNGTLGSHFFKSQLLWDVSSMNRGFKNGMRYIFFHKVQEV